MSINQGAKISTRGLVFAYDMPTDNSVASSNKSWKGAPVTNVVTNTNLNTGWSQGYNTDIVFNDYPPPNGINSQVVSFRDADGNGSGYWYSYGDYAPQSPSTTYAVSVYARTAGSGTFSIQPYTANNSETGRQWLNTLTVPNDGKWHRLEFNTITTPSNTQSDSLSFHFPSITANKRCWLCAPQMTATSYHVPFFDGTRSNTESLLDWTGNSTITTTSLSYNSDGTFTFNNSSSNYIDLPNSIGYTGNNVSVFAWFKSNGTPSGGYHIVCGGQELEISVPTAGALRVGIYSGQRYVSNHGSGLTDGNWHYIGFTSDGMIKTAYIDGVSVGTQSVAGTLTTSVGNRRIGRFGGDGSYYANADIPIYQVYNKTLSPDEVAQNYNALKNRFV